MSPLPTLKNGSFESSRIYAIEHSAVSAHFRQSPHKSVLKLCFALTHSATKLAFDTPVLRNYWTQRLRATLQILWAPKPMRASLLGMYLVQAVAFGAKRLAQRRGVALRSTAAYDALTKELREVARLEEVSGILSYDEQCFMSEGSAASRAAQKEALAGVIHEKRTSARMAEVIDAARGLQLDDARENANVRDAIEGFDVESRKSKDLAEREARLESECFVRLGVP